MARLGVSTRPAVIASAVARCPAVAALSPGADGNVVTYLPDRRVVGVRKVLDGVAVHIIAWFGPTITEIVDQVRAAITAVAPECQRIDVIVDDLEIPPGGPARTAGKPAGKAADAAGRQPRGTGGTRTGGTRTRGGAGGKPGRGHTAVATSAAAEGTGADAGSRRQ
jgi:hypothetical protein